MLVSGGNYHSYATPNYYNKIFNLLSSQQLACDYSYDAKDFGAKAAVYYKNENGKKALNSYISIDKVETFGVEAYVEYDFSSHFKITASNLFIDQKLHQDGKRFHGSFDFNCTTKVALQYNDLRWLSASITRASRQLLHANRAYHFCASS